MRLFRAAIPEMEKSGGGAFVTVASLGGLKAGIAGSAYIASKHGVLGLAKNVAYMYAKKNSRSNVIAPGGVNTEMGTNVEGNSEMGMERCTLGMGTMPRMGEPEEIAQLALFLASDDASLINGAVVTADAGWGCY
ncbi:MAG: SDR family oxidoreductase [Halobacteriota archaeon]